MTTCTVMVMTLEYFIYFISQLSLVFSSFSYVVSLIHYI